MIPESPAEKRKIGDILLWPAISAVILIFGLVVWSNHFNNQFHADDFHVIVDNHAVRDLANIPRFFSQPRTFSSEPENADYKPLLLVSFALDAGLTKSLNPLVFQMDTFAWFGLLMFSLYLLFRLIPGTHPGVALLGAALFGLHPVAAETVNYVSQRGQIMSAAGVALALALWIIWPRRLPRRLGLNLDRVPQNWWQHQIRIHGAGLELFYKGLLALPIPFYLLPLIPALLAEPSTAVFVLLLGVYIHLFDPETSNFRLLPPALICGGYWLAQTALAWTVSPGFRISSFSYWMTQPWVAIRYLYSFFMPVHLSADSGFQPVAHFWSPLAIAGIAGVALLVRLGILLGRRPEWRGVAFGIWWFLIGLAPAALIPQRSVEANSRMFLAAAGLAFAAAHLAAILFARLYTLAAARNRQTMAIVCSSVMAFILLSGLGWMTWQRNAVWETESTLWLDVTERSPENGRGFINYAAAVAANNDEATSLFNLQRAVPLSTGDAALQIGLGQGFSRLSRDTETEFHFRRAIALAPRYSAAYSYYGHWLLSQQRGPEAFEISTKAVALNPSDLIAHRTLLDIYAQRSDWAMVAKAAKELLALDPDDPAGKRLLILAGTVADELRRAEAGTEKSPGVNEYLKLSVVYYRSHRYEDSINASRNALKLRPDLAEAWANIAAADHTMGRDDEAISALHEALRIRPDMAFARTDLEILIGKKKSDEHKK